MAIAADTLLMIPGPIEVSPAVVEAYAVRAPAHLAPHVIEAHGSALEKMRDVWCASPDSQPLIIAGSGTIAMESAAANLVANGDAVVVVNTGYFSDRIGEMAKRYGASVTHVRAEPGQAPTPDAIRAAVEAAKPTVLFATHVDTSTGVRTDAESIAAIARECGALSVFDGVCATAGEVFRMDAWNADVYLTASQKAIGLPPGLALLVASPAALARRDAIADGPMAIDWKKWQPIMQAYEARERSYFSTPATNLILALDASLDEILEHGIEARFDLHQRTADGMRAAWATLGLGLVPADGLAANTLSAVRYPTGVGPELVGKIAAHRVVVAGGLHPAIKSEYFRVGHMGYSATQPDHLQRTIAAVARALDIEPSDALAAFEEYAQSSR